MKAKSEISAILPTLCISMPKLKSRKTKSDHPVEVSVVNGVMSR